MARNPWTTLNKKIVYENPWIKVREDEVTCPDGSPGIYGVVETVVATGALAVNDKNEVYLIGQYRYPVDIYSWEIVAGGAKPNEPAIDAAKRELQEEAGLIASDWVQLGGEVHTSNCISNEVAHLFLARGLKEVVKNPDPTEILEVKIVPFAEALKMAREGGIVDAMSIIAITRAEKYL